jgi:hypothetical protein
VPFDITWSSSDATSCTGSGFTTGDATSDTISQTATTVGEVTYTITCTGASGTTPATAQKTVNVSAQATAEGLWQGAGTSGSVVRNLSGVVTKENAYWLVYNGDSAGSDADNAMGFMAGTGTSVLGANQGTFNSGDLREFNFENLGALGGGLTLGTFNKAAADKATHTLAATSTTSSLADPTNFTGSQSYAIETITIDCGSGCATVVETPQPPTFTDGGNTLSIVPSAAQAIDGTHPAGLSGSFVFAPYSINVDLNNFGFPYIVDLNYPDRVLNFSGGNATWDQNSLTLTITEVTIVESAPSTVCTDNANGDACDFVPGPSVPTQGDISITYTDSTLKEYTGVAHTYQVAISSDEDTDGDGDPTTGPSVDLCLAQGGIDVCANGTLTFSGRVPTNPSLSQTLATTYNAAYESEPAVADIGGSYTGAAGIGSTIAGGATFEIDAGDGTVTGGDSTGCTYTGSVAPHAPGGNVYDVSLTFASGGTCTYSGAFSGVATYDATTSNVTVTAVNGNKDQGFLFTGAKAQ